MIEQVKILPQTKINQNFEQKISSNDNTIVQNNTERNISSEAANSLKSQMLYSLNKQNNEFIEYLKPDMDKSAIIKELCDKDKMGGKSFNKILAYHMAYLITHSKNPELSTKNFNIIMNTKDIHNKSEIYDLLFAANRVNDGKQQNIWGFNGGELTKENIEAMLKERTKYFQDLGNFAMGMAIGMNI